MTFIPCAATVAAIRQESRSWRFTGISLALMLLVAFVLGISRVSGRLTLLDFVYSGYPAVWTGVTPGEAHMQIYIDGSFYSEDDAKISVFDHGLLYGDGVFEGIRVYGGPGVRVGRPHRPSLRVGSDHRAGDTHVEGGLDRGHAGDGAAQRGL